MDSLAELWRRLVVLLRGARFDAELEEEMQYHVELEAADREADGATPVAARHAARRRFGNALLLREESRAAWGWSSLEAWWSDIRRALRTIRRAPLSAAVAASSLAVGIALCTTVFNLGNALLFQPLPVRAPETLVDVFTSTSTGTRYGTSSYPDYLDLRDRNDVFTDLVAFSPMVAPLSLDDRSRAVIGEVVTGNYFQGLGVPAHLGRTLDPSDDRPGADRVVMVSYGFWQRALASAPDVVGRTIRLQGEPFTVVGVAPSWFNGMTPLLALDIWLPIAHVRSVKPGGLHDTVPSPTGTSRLDRRGQRWLFAKGRVKPGVTAEAASAHLQVLMGQLAATHPHTNAARRMSTIPTNQVRLHPDINDTLLPIAMALLVAVGLALLVVCANVSSMLLARASGRSAELAVRQALGASRWQLVRQTIVESLTLAGGGAGGGVLLAWGLTRIASAMPLGMPVPVSLDLRLGGRALLFAVGASAAAGLLTGLAPALRSARTDLMQNLRIHGSDKARLRRRLPSPGDVLVAGQIAVSLVLLVSGLLLARSVWVSTRAEVGFDPHGLVNLATEPSLAGYDAERSERFWVDAVQRVRAIPGVERVAIASRLPFSLNTFDTTLEIPGRNVPGDQGTSVWSARVSPDYFATLGVRILAGRPFADTDHQGTPPVAIVNETMARRYWPGRSAVGQRVRVREADNLAVEIVGVAADHRIRTVGERRESEIFFAIGQLPVSYAVVAARTSGDAGRLLADIRQVLLTLEPRLVFTEDQTMEAQLAATLLPVRAGAWLVGVVGVVGALLAAIGLYAVITHAVSRRTREIGIRLAVGSSPTVILGLVLRHGLKVAGAGLGVGAALAAAAASGIAGAVYGVGSSDPLAWSGALAGLLLFTAVANLVPAWRASRLDPVAALRVE